MSVREKRIEQAIELYEEGCNASEIGRRLHVNHTTIIEWLKERGVYRTICLSQEQLDDIRLYYVNYRMPVEEVARLMKLPEQKVKNAIQTHHIHRREYTEEEKEKMREAYRKEGELFAKVTVKSVDDPLFYVPRSVSNESVTYHGKKYKDVSGFYLGG